MDCLHQATADQAFSKIKADGDVAGMAHAFMSAALKRYTGKVDLARVKCAATNPEIGAIFQHQFSLSGVRVLDFTIDRSSLKILPRPTQLQPIELIVCCCPAGCEVPSQQEPSMIRQPRVTC